MSTENQEDKLLDNRTFFSNNLVTHLARKRLTEVLDAKTHWVFAITNDCGALAMRLNQLHVERFDGYGIEIIAMGSLPMCPVLLMFPRDKLDLGEFAEMIGGWPTSREVIESKDYITITSQDPEPIMQSINQWISIDHLMS